MDDCQLLADYTEHGSETAFHTLVSRHLSFVYSAAFRQVNDPQLAEEVSQAVFILLARKAGSFRRSVVLTGWLFRTTRFVATRALRSEQRRQRREQEAFEMQQLTTPDDNWQRIAPVLDEAVARLGETERNAVLLRFFNDKSHRETAAALGISEDAAKKRVARALEKLRHFFAARNVTLSVAVLGSAIAANAAKAATPEVIGSVVGRVFADSSTPGVSLLVSQTLAAWRWARLRIASAVGVVALTAAFLIHSIATHQPEVNQSATAEEANANLISTSGATDNGNLAGQPALDLEKTNTMLFRAVDAQTGAGIADARVAVNYVSQSKWWAGNDLTTDAQGMCRILIPEELGRLDVGVLKNGHVQKFYTWRKDFEVPLPSVYVLKVERSVAIGGRVLDESGEPIFGAELVINFPEIGDSSGREPNAERLGFIRKLVAARTDAQGRWACAVVPPDYDRFTLKVSHPQFAAQTVIVGDQGRNYPDPPPHLAMKDLWTSNTIVTLRRGLEASGVVLDDAGKPLAGVKISTFAGHGFPDARATTRSDGTFQFGGLGAGATRIEASVAEFAPASQTVDVQSNVSNLVFRLDRGTTVSIRVVDEDGSGVVGAWVVADGPERTSADWRVITDSDGWARIEGIPEAVHNNLRFHAGAGGFFISRDERVDLSVPEPRLQLRRALRVSGQVVDATSGEAIKWFKVIPCRSEGMAGYDRGDRKFGTNGNFTVAFSEFHPPFRVRIEAEGYEPALSSPIPLEPREASVQIKIQRQDPAKAIRGLVQLPGGQLAADAEVALLTIERGVTLNQGKFESRDDGHTILTRTDADGNFQFDQDVNAHTIVVAHSLGFGRARVRGDGQTLVVQLSPWGRIDGTVRTRDHQWSSRAVALSSHHSEAGLWVSGAAISDAEGSFSFERVPEGDHSVHLNPGIGKAFTDTTLVEVHAGRTATAQIGGSGVTVIGRLKFASDGSVDWAKQTKFPTLQPKNSSPPVPHAAFDPHVNDPAEKRKRLDLVESDAWRAWAKSQRPGVALKIAADGSFVAEGLRAGEYTLRVELASDSGDSSRDPIASMRRPTIASIQQSVVVSEAEEQAEEILDLGALVLQPEVQKQ